MQQFQIKSFRLQIFKVFPYSFYHVKVNIMITVQIYLILTFLNYFAGQETNPRDSCILNKSSTVTKLDLKPQSKLHAQFQIYPSREKNTRTLYEPLFSKLPSFLLHPQSTFSSLPSQEGYISGHLNLRLLEINNLYF